MYLSWCKFTFMFRRLITKCTYALRGLVYTFRRELSFRLELAGALALFALAAYWEVAWPAWLSLILATAFVLGIEVINTVLERLLDLVEPRLSIHVALLKDLLAAAVVIAILATASVAAVVYFVSHV